MSKITEFKFTGRTPTSGRTPSSKMEKGRENMHDLSHEYDDECECCQPGLIDLKTGKQMEKDHPVMIAVLKAWKERTTFAERRATSRVWMGQSTNPTEIRIMEKVGGMIQEVIKEIEE